MVSPFFIIELLLTLPHILLVVPMAGPFPEHLSSNTFAIDPGRGDRLVHAKQHLVQPVVSSKGVGNDFATETSKW